MISASRRPRHQDELLGQHLRALFGAVDAATVERLRQRLDWLEISGGGTLMTEGEPGDAMYWTISGRLRAYVRADDGSQHVVREMGRGTSVGEMSLFTGEPRAATVVAIRDSVLVRLRKSDFADGLATSPELAMALTCQVIAHLRRDRSHLSVERPVTIGIVPITGGVDQWDFAVRLARHLRPHGRVEIVDSAKATADHVGDGDGAGDDRRMALLLDEIEAANDFVLLVGDREATSWSLRVGRHSDELLLLADALQPPVVHRIEEALLAQRAAHAEAAEILVLLHAADVRLPSGTRQWLDRRPVADHIHVRPALERDMARLARMQSRTGVGLVLAGGGARGLAHLGVYRALAEHGIEVDCVGGTSIGATMAMCVASDQPPDVVTASARRAFRVNPTGDFNLLPLLSLVKGKRLRRILRAGADEVLGANADIEDLWKNYYCVASNYSQAQQHVFRRGNVVTALLASVAIPGALPPVVHDGDLLCDGGTFNNFPIDIMASRRGIGRVIGVDLDFRRMRRLDIDDVPGSWTLLRDRLRPRKLRRYHLPSLTSLMLNATILYSKSRQDEARRRTDLYFNPPLERIGLLEWAAFERIVDQGYAHAVEVLRNRAAKGDEWWVSVASFGAPTDPTG
jgi:NTE family protein